MKPFDENAEEGVENSESESTLIPGLNGSSLEDDLTSSDDSQPSRGPLALLMAILILGGGGLYFMHIKSKPDAASASSEAANAKTTINNFLSDGGKSLKQVKELLQNTEAVVENFTKNESPQVKLEELKSNPFEVQKPKVAASNDDAATKARQAAIEREKAEITKQAEKLQLQSILYSPGRSSCMLSGQAYEAGDRVEGGFVLEAIEKTCIILKKGEYSFKLTMKSN